MLKQLKIAGTDDQPEVLFDKERNIFKISGRSLPEDSYEFYLPLVEWMEQYVKDPNPSTQLNISLEYLNSSSVKQIFFFLTKMETLIKNGKEAKIVWYCYYEDVLMHEKCKIFQKLLIVPFEILEYKKGEPEFKI